MKDKILKFGSVAFLILLVLFSSFGNTINSINAQINQTYNKATGGMSATDDPNTDNQIKESKISDALGQFVLGIASLVEKLIGYVFRSVTGTADFPWADRVIFNAVPLLDVNFFAPSDNSFFLKGGNDTQIAKIIRNTYFTILSICLAFLTIVVAIAAVRMSLTALANEKAKYKEAITKWLFSIVLIFLMHNLISFIFFVNEAMVEAASNILITSLNEYRDQDSAIRKTLEEQLDDETMVKNFIAGNEGIFTNTKEAEDYLLENVEVSAYLLRNKTFREVILKYASDDSAWDAFKNTFKRFIGLFGGSSLILENPINIVKSTLELAADEEKLSKLEKLVNEYLQMSKKQLERRTVEDTNGEKITVSYEGVKAYKVLVDAARNIRNNFVKQSEADGGKWLKRPSSGDVKINIIANLAETLRDSAYTYLTDDEGNVIGWKPSAVSVSGALLYAIFVAQSILYFFSYIKRFFYIIVLAIMAPVIVLFDFLGKALG